VCFHICSSHRQLEGELSQAPGTVLAPWECRVGHSLLCPTESVWLQRKRREVPCCVFCFFSTLKLAAFLI
jgi:hypothetical protein